MNGQTNPADRGSASRSCEAGIAFPQRALHRPAGGGAELKTLSGRRHLRLAASTPSIIYMRASAMKALLIDDHPLILSALQTVIEGMGGHVTVAAVASASAARETLAADADFDLVLLDLQLGDADGFDLLAELRAAYPALPVVVVSASDRSEDVLRALDLGAMGFVPKRASNAALYEALHTVMSGGIYVPPMTITFGDPQGPAHAPASSRLNGNGFAHSRPQDLQPAMSPGRPLASLGFTPRQTDVLGLLLKGQPNKLIARELNLSVETVKDHVAAVLRTLNVSSRTQAVLAVSQMVHRDALPAWREARQG
jgi:DNA-binding NarL/FixJ family response regulator